MVLYIMKYIVKWWRLMDITELIDKYKKEQQLIESMINLTNIHQNSLLISKLDVYEEIIKDLEKIKRQ